MFSFFFNDPATTEIYTLSLHDALPIFRKKIKELSDLFDNDQFKSASEFNIIPCSSIFITDEWNPNISSAILGAEERLDRKSTRLNSSHVRISYAVFCLKKKNYNKLANS